MWATACLFISYTNTVHGPLKFLVWPNAISLSLSGLTEIPILDLQLCSCNFLWHFKYLDIDTFLYNGSCDRMVSCKNIVFSNSESLKKKTFPTGLYNDSLLCLRLTPLILTHCGWFASFYQHSSRKTKSLNLTNDWVFLGHSHNLQYSLELFSNILSKRPSWCRRVSRSRFQLQPGWDKSSFNWPSTVSCPADGVLSKCKIKVE